MDEQKNMPETAPENDVSAKDGLPRAGEARPGAGMPAAYRNFPGMREALNMRAPLGMNDEIPKAQPEPAPVRPQQEPVPVRPQPEERVRQPVSRPAEPVRPAEPAGMPPFAGPAPGAPVRHGTDPRQEPYAERYVREPKEKKPAYGGYKNDAYEAAYREEMMKASGKKARRAEKGRHHTAIGVIILLFALFGAGCAVYFGVSGISAVREKKQRETFAKYESLLIPVAAVAPESFDDLADASMDDLIRIAVWSIIGGGVSPEQYVYSDSEMKIPEADVAAAYAKYFGSQLPPGHRTVEGYGYEFKYSEADGAYFIPMTTLEPVYTPRVVSESSKSGATVVECEMINTNVWKQDTDSGAVVRPDADFSIRVTFRSSPSGTYISSVRSLGLPETAIPSAVYTAPQEPQTNGTDTETTSQGQNIVITWD